MPFCLYTGAACPTEPTDRKNQQEDEMVIVNVMYPASVGAKFDMDYYRKTHIPLVRARWNGVLRDLKILTGAGTPSGGPSTYSVIALLTFDSAADFDQAVVRHGAEIIGDIPNFSSVQPVIQVNDVLDY
jgi:uncharacterized protein (TIGR02118 family)